jgi:hypothetical protein
MMEKTNTKDKKIPKSKFYFLLLTSYFSLKKAQVMIEFTFCMIILFLMMYGIVMVFRWVGLDLGQRQRAHKALLESEIDLNYGHCVTWLVCATTRQRTTCADPRAVEAGPLSQMDPYFYAPTSINAVWVGN